MPEITVPVRLSAPVLWRAALALLLLAALGMSALALGRIGIDEVADAVVSIHPGLALVAFALMAASMAFRSEAWCAIIGSALPHHAVRRGEVARATLIGVFMSAILPGRVGEAARAIVLSRRLGRISSCLPVVVGTVFSQALLNVLGLFAVAAVAFASAPALQAHAGALTVIALVPAALLVLVLSGPWLFERVSPDRPLLGRVASVLAVRLAELRSGLRVFRRVSAASHALSAQLAAWALQLLSVYALLVAFRLDDQAGIAAAAAVLTAVNVTGIVPVTPSNVGIFQATCVVVLAAWGIGAETALAYGILLQAIEVAVAVALGLPALAGEHISFRAIRQTAERMPALDGPAASGIG